MVSLKIKGNKRGNEGLGVDLMAIGDVHFQVVDSQYPGAGGVTDFIVIRHLEDKSVYTFVTKNVTPADSNRQGTLLISVAVPAGEQVDRLFDLLLELSGYYKSNYMTYDGCLYHFKTVAEQPEGFMEILSRYSVSPYPFKRVKMLPDPNEVAYIFMRPEQISEVLTDSMRPEFSRFGQIALVPVADPESVASTINIPSRIWRNYKISVNGRLSKQTLSDPAKVINISLPETSTHYGAAVKLSIMTARAGEVAGVMVDDYNQVINVTLTPEPKTMYATMPQPTGGAPAAGSTVKIVLISSISAIVVLGGVLAAAFYFGWFGNLGSEVDKFKSNIENITEIPEKAEPLTDEIDALGDSIDRLMDEIFDENNEDADNDHSKASDETTNAAAAAALQQLRDCTFDFGDLDGIRAYYSDPAVADSIRSEINELATIHMHVINAFKSKNFEEYKAGVINARNESKDRIPKLYELLDQRYNDFGDEEKAKATRKRDLKRTNYLE